VCPPIREGALDRPKKPSGRHAARLRRDGITARLSCSFNFLAIRADLTVIVAKVTEVLADLILMAPPDEQSMLMADILANLGSFLLEKKEESDPTKPRHSRH